MNDLERHEEIQELAYRFWELRDHYHMYGTPEADWLKAEKIVRDRERCMEHGPGQK